MNSTNANFLEELETAIRLSAALIGAPNTGTKICKADIKTVLAATNVYVTLEEQERLLRLRLREVVALWVYEAWLARQEAGDITLYDISPKDIENAIPIRKP